MTFSQHFVILFSRHITWTHISLNKALNALHMMKSEVFLKPTCRKVLFRSSSPDLGDDMMQVKVVVGIHNEGPETYNITAVMGSINNVKNFKDYHQNFTTQVRDLCTGVAL